MPIEYKCEYCYKILSTKQKMLEHQNKPICINNRVNNVHECIFCKKRSKDRNTLIDHYINCDGFEEMNSVSDRSCHYCFAVLCNNKSAKRHEKTCRFNKDAPMYSDDNQDKYDIFINNYLQCRYCIHQQMTINPNYDCKYSKEYESLAGLKCHIKSCQMRQKFVIFNDIVKDVVEKIKPPEPVNNKNINTNIVNNTINNITNNVVNKHITNNITNNIINNTFILIPYKAIKSIKDIKDLPFDLEKCRDMLNTTSLPTKIFPHITKLNHANENIPERNNIYLVHPKAKTLNVFRHDGWSEEDTQKIAKELMGGSKLVLTYLFDLAYQAGYRDPDMIDNFNKCMEMLEKDGKVSEDVIKKIISVIHKNKKNVEKYREISDINFENMRKYDDSDDIKIIKCKPKIITKKKKIKSYSDTDSDSS